MIVHVLFLVSSGLSKSGRSSKVSTIGYINTLKGIILLYLDKHCMFVWVIGDENGSG